MNENKMEKRSPQEAMEMLKQYLNGLGSAAVAFSGGVDSTFLLKTAHDVLGDRAIALTVSSAFFPVRELDEARRFCQKEGIRQVVCEIDELSIGGLAQNPKNRCYLCKRELFVRMWESARAQGMEYLLEGSNLDDEGDYRPGLQAVAELRVQSPLRRCRMTKEEIRILSKELGLPTWEKPSFACLASRFVYGEEITREKLAMVDRAEQLLLDLGFSQERVRIHGRMARIEVLPEEFDKVLQRREEIASAMKAYGFTYVALDLQGYRTGSMNQGIGTGSMNQGIEKYAAGDRLTGKDTE